MRLLDMYVTAGGPGSGCRGPNCGRPPGSGRIPRSSFPLTPVQRKMETRARAQALKHGDELIAQYRKEHGNNLNADDAKELFADYRNNRTDGAAAVHEAASYLVKQMFAEDLAQPPGPGKDNYVLFTAGGAGAGKTSAMKHSLGDLQDKAQIVYDGTLRPADKAIIKIEQVLKAGKNVEIAFIYRDPEDSFRGGVLTRAQQMEDAKGSGRTVPLGEFASQHSSIVGSMRAVAEKYKNDPRVELRVIDNTHGHLKSQLSSLDRIPDDPPKEALKAKLSAALEDEHNRGRISDRIYRATKGAGAAKEVGM